jgi:hypothetical protein
MEHVNLKLQPLKERMPLRICFVRCEQWRRNKAPGSSKSPVTISILGSLQIYAQRKTLYGETTKEVETHGSLAYSVKPVVIKKLNLKYWPGNTASTSKNQIFTIFLISMDSQRSTAESEHMNCQLIC